MRSTVLLFLAFILVAGCWEEPLHPMVTPNFAAYGDEEYEAISAVLNIPQKVDHYDVGNGFLSSDYKATLGRILFYDEQLSRDMSVSCASCHDQQHAFADPVNLSTGIFGRTTARNSIALGSFTAFSTEYGDGGSGGATPPLFNKPLFWDMRATSVHAQMEETIANNDEMGMSLKEVADRLRDQEHYAILFEKAFGSSTVSESRILDALETFMRAIKADNTRLELSLTDHTRVSTAFLMQHDLSLLSKQENHGMRIFLTKCASCHQSSLGGKVDPPNRLHETFFANNGLDIEYADKGRGEVTGIKTDNGVFKIPSLRNVALTYPYMHDGRYATLEEVVDFYSEGIQPHENLDFRLKNSDLSPARMYFSKDEKMALVAFLNSLTDMKQIGHLKFSDPWK